MQIMPEKSDLKWYLRSNEIIDFDNPMDHGIRDLAEKIQEGSSDQVDYIKRAYEYVRDQIGHSADIKAEQVTCKASEVLREGHGICLAKSHLLAALLRCQGIPAGFCYQKLILNDETAPYLIIHGLNGIYIDKYNKWIRLDARGNKSGVQAEFSIEQEKLAFPVRSEKGEEDLPIVLSEPDANVIEALTKNRTLTELWASLPTELAIY